MIRCWAEATRHSAEHGRTGQRWHKTAIATAKTRDAFKESGKPNRAWQQSEPPRRDDPTASSPFRGIRSGRRRTRENTDTGDAVAAASFGTVTPQPGTRISPPSRTVGSKADRPADKVFRNVPGSDLENRAADGRWSTTSGWSAARRENHSFPPSKPGGLPA